MVYTKEILNSSCSISFIDRESRKLYDLIYQEIIMTSETKKEVKINVSDFCAINLMGIPKKNNPEKSLFYTIKVTILMLKKVFTDSKIYTQKIDNNDYIIVNWAN